MAIIIAKGKVQKVRDIANSLGAVGEAENLEDGSVKIVAEVKKAVLGDLTEKIKIKNYLIDVRDVSVSFEDATGEFSPFKKVIVKYGKMAENVERILEELKEERKEYRGSIEKLVDAIIESKKTSS